MGLHRVNTVMPALGLPRSRARFVFGSLAAVAALASLAVIWWARMSLWPRTVYVSELGSPVLPTADAFNSALLLLAVGGLLGGLSGRGLRSTVRILGAWTVTASLVTAGAMFAFASRVTCTPGCPVPFTPTSTVQDLLHTTAAVVGFAAASWAMLQVAWADPLRGIRLYSRATAVTVAVVAATGGMLSILRFRTDIGGMLELIATSFAVLWLAVFSASRALRRGAADGPPAPASTTIPSPASATTPGPAPAQAHTTALTGAISPRSAEAER
jgi:hypothetical protein